MNNGPIKTVRRTPIRETDLGVYVWQRPNGKFLANENGDVLNIPSEFGDISKMMELQRSAHYWLGVMDLPPEGKAVFWDVHRCTEEEYLEQVYEMQQGVLSDTNVRRNK
jgi:hypothetical protein